MVTRTYKSLKPADSHLHLTIFGHLVAKIMSVDETFTLFALLYPIDWR